MRIIAGWKTKTGNLMIAIGGLLLIASIWLSEIPDRAIGGLIVLGFAIAFNGAYNRFCRVFYGLDQNGNPSLRRSRVKKKQRGGSL